MEYTFLRTLAGSIGTVFLVLSFAGFILYAFRPGSRRIHEDTSEIPFRHDEKPAPETVPDHTTEARK